MLWGAGLMVMLVPVPVAMPAVAPALAMRAYRSAGSTCRIQLSTETRKLATMIPIATIRLKLDSTPPSATPAW